MTFPEQSFIELIYLTLIDRKQNGRNVLGEDKDVSASFYVGCHLQTKGGKRYDKESKKGSTGC